MRDYPDELEADLLQFFGVDLLDYWRRRVSFRRLSILVIRLLSMPGESSLAEAKFGERARWGYKEHLLADVVDRLNIANWMVVQVNKSAESDNPFPEPHPRPGAGVASEKKKQEFASPHEVATFFSNLSSG
ncbi:hypothetical protein [Nonomuraea sp. NPDC049141]|uniref:hypothetical protein n=1 Tax=Nonomuraea sp. NPDC049141 TaxID=3155500 RepID=UPI0033FFDCB4